MDVTAAQKNININITKVMYCSDQNKKLTVCMEDVQYVEESVPIWCNLIWLTTPTHFTSHRKGNQNFASSSENYSIEEKKNLQKTPLPVSKV